MNPNEIISFWFSPQVRPLWFNSTPEFDNELKQNYSELFDRAANGELTDWQESPQGCLALVIILDQFPLNIYRGQAKSFTTEALAINVVDKAIENRFDQSLNDEQKAFLYMPLMLSENINDQDRSVELFEKAGLKENLKFAKHHREIIRRFARFPHRNAILNRENTAEEIEYLGSKEAFLG